MPSPEQIPKAKKGKIELAEGGTLFLDEIGEMPLELQVKLLRVLQEKSYFPVGGTRMKQADCRIIAATNQNLMSMIARNQFREDLYYRLNVINLVIPPLRMRKEDIYELTQTFLQEFSLLYNRHIELVPPEVFKLLFQYDWPGNVRELRNVIERLTILTTDGEVKQEYLPDTLTSLIMQEQSEVQLTSGIHSYANNENQQRQDSAGAEPEKEPRSVANVDELDPSDDSELVSGVTYQQKLDTYRGAASNSISESSRW